MNETDIAVEFLLENLELALSNFSYSILAKENPIVISLYEDLKIIKTYSKRIQESPGHQKGLLSSLLPEIRDVALKILEATDSCVIKGLAKDDENLGREICSLFQNSPELAFRANQIDSFKKVVLGVHNDDFSFSMVNKDEERFPNIRRRTLPPHGSPQEGEVSSRTKSTSPTLEEEKMVGCDEEAIELLDRLTGNQKQLEMISLVGMAGVGKTTLAKRLYNDPRVVYHFHVRGWTCLPRDEQTFSKWNFIYNILSSIVNDNDSLYQMTEGQMHEKLYKCLKGRRYLIVIDDIWDHDTCYYYLTHFFPNDSTGSKILMTSRVKDAVSQFSSPHVLRFLTPNESWNLFKNKVFTNESCPQELIKLGREIAAKSKGLPLATVVLAGLAKKEKTRNWWLHIAKKTSSCIHGEEEQFMDILELSFEHLPNWLKPCFLYLGSFPQNHEIPVKKIVWSWIAEGFIEHTGEKKLEDVAENYLTDLADRSLVIVSKKRSNGGIKSCFIHDLFRDLCAKKSKENMFLQPICGYEQVSICESNCPIFSNSSFTGRLIVNGVAEYAGGKIKCQCFHSYNFHYVKDFKPIQIEISIFPEERMSLVYKLLKLLDLGYIILEHFPMEILQLLHLRCLALRIYRLRKLPLLSNLWNLETFFLSTEKGQRVTLPQDIWKMEKLRHLYISGELEIENACLSSSSPSVLHNLQTISQLCPAGSILDVLARIPNLIKLGFHLTLSKTAELFEFPDLSSLNLLETLKFEYQTLGMVPFSIPQPSKFPPNLKKLTLIGSYAEWKEMSIIEMLPNLEVLKIKDNFFSGPLWETSSGQFCRLKFLKFSHLDLQQWIASSSNFPSLEKLVLNACLDLEEIPSCIGDIYTLQTIEVYRSSQTAADSARQIQESQKDMGNDELKVLIHPHFEEE